MESRTRIAHPLHRQVTGNLLGIVSELTAAEQAGILVDLEPHVGFQFEGVSQVVSAGHLHGGTVSGGAGVKRLPQGERIDRLVLSDRAVGLDSENPHGHRPGVAEGRPGPDQA